MVSLYGVFLLLCVCIIRAHKGAEESSGGGSMME